MSKFPFHHLDDVSLNLALYELAHGPVRFNNDRLECLYYNPISNCNTVIIQVNKCKIHSVDKVSFVLDNDHFPTSILVAESN